MRALRIILSDFFGLVRVCGPAVASRWLWMVTRHFKQCRRDGNLAPADRAMGPGPFRCRVAGGGGGASALLSGEGSVMGGIREIWVRDIYLGGGFLRIPADGFVVDLGAHSGLFTLLALGHGPGVSVVAVEPSHSHQRVLRRALADNGLEGRARVVQCFLGGRTAAQELALAGQGVDEAQGVPFMGQQEFARLLADAGAKRIDLLKCDIEGSEFELLTPDSPLLRMTRQLAIELHDEAGDRRRFIEMLRGQGFEVRVGGWDHRSCNVMARRPRADTETEAEDPPPPARLRQPGAPRHAGAGQSTVR